MTTNWLDKKARLACGKSKCHDDCFNKKFGYNNICNVCMRAYINGYKAGYKAKKTKQ